MRALRRRQDLRAAGRALLPLRSDARAPHCGCGTGGLRGRARRSGRGCAGRDAASARVRRGTRCAANSFLPKPANSWNIWASGSNSRLRARRACAAWNCTWEGDRAAAPCLNLRFGLSRYALDALLAEAAAGCGARVRRGETEMHPDIAATGRAGRAVRGNRLFGFKTHFTGPVDDAVELFFFARRLRRCEPGGARRDERVLPCSGIVAGRHGIRLRRRARRPARLWPSACARSRARWSGWPAGPLVFGAQEVPPAALYAAGDALGFVDPFTGTGVLNALVSGCLAGTAAARGIAPEEYRRQVRYALATSVCCRRAVPDGARLRLGGTTWLPSFRLAGCSASRGRARIAPIGSAALFPR